MGSPTPLILDVTNADQTQGAVETVESLDILINDAGMALFDDLSDRAALERNFAVNLLGTYGVTQALLPLLTRSRGALVNILSVAALATWPIVPASRSQRRPHCPCHNRSGAVKFGLTGPICACALKSLHLLELRPRRHRDWPIKPTNREYSPG
ncbi:MAG TPA: SDR family NAD(P)-dependent oxidoreductase [Candidatus Sulfotelmatobacter sp.]|jgi:NAD(P)-dependent dehydrogenase (short-subunit alcohol dehydrogenase family)